MGAFKRIESFFLRLLVQVRKQQRALEARLDRMRPHPVLGALFVLVGAALCLGGLVMLVTPGPGLLALALGIAAISAGVKVVRGEYGPQRVERERARKHRRLQRRRARQRTRSVRCGGRGDAAL